MENDNTVKRKGKFLLLEIFNLFSNNDYLYVTDWSGKCKIRIPTENLSVIEILQAIKFRAGRKRNLERCHNNGVLSKLQWSYRFSLDNYGEQQAKEDLRMDLTFIRPAYRFREFSKRTFYRLKKWVLSLLPNYDFSLWKQVNDHCPNCYHNLKGKVVNVVK